MHARQERSPKRILLEEIPFIGVAVRHMLCARLPEKINPMHRVQLVMHARSRERLRSHTARGISGLARRAFSPRSRLSMCG